ncbi:MAG: SurA N-terminal domain-containing protein [Thermodesulfobacteriota bacterium]
MLHFVRRHAQSKFVKVVLGIIIAVFVLWGVEAVVSGGNPLTTVATVDGRPIEQIEIQRAELNMAEAYREAYKGNFTPEMRQALNLRQRALDGLIDRLVLLNQAERLGIEITDQELRDVIVDSRGFAPGGRFDKDYYVRVLRSIGLTPGQYEEMRREDLAAERLQALVQDGVTVGDQEVRDEVLAREERRTVAFVKFAAADETAAVEVTDEALQKYFEDNKARYTEPEKAKVELLAYAPDKFEGRVEVAEEDVTEYYEANLKTRFTQPHEVHARHILVRVAPDADDETKQKARKRLEEVQEKLRGGADFAALAKQYSDDPGSKEKGGDLGFFPRGRMTPPFEEAAFALKAGETSDIVESSFGLHLIRVDEVREEREKPLDEVRDEVVQALETEAATEKAREAAEEDRTALVGGESIDAVAERRGFTVERPAPLTRGAAFPNLGRSMPLTTALWELPIGGYTEPTDVNGTMVIAKLVEKVPSRVPGLAEVKDRVEAAYRLERGGEAAKKKAEELHAAAAGAGGLAKAAEAAGKKAATTPQFGRAGAYVPEIGGSAELKDAVFALTEEKRLPDGVFVVAGDAYVVELAERTVPSDEDIAKKIDDTRKSLVERRRADTFGRYLEELKKRAQIEVNAQRLQEIPPV